MVEASSGDETPTSYTRVIKAPLPFSTPERRSSFGRDTGSLFPASPKGGGSSNPFGGGGSGNINSGSTTYNPFGSGGSAREVPAPKRPKYAWEDSDSDSL